MTKKKMFVLEYVVDKLAEKEYTRQDPHSLPNATSFGVILVSPEDIVMFCNGELYLNNVRICAVTKLSISEG